MNDDCRRNGTVIVCYVCSDHEKHQINCNILKAADETVMVSLTDCMFRSLTHNLNHINLVMAADDATVLISSAEYNYAQIMERCGRDGADIIW